MTAAIAPGATGSITNTVTLVVPGSVINTGGSTTASDTDTLVAVTALGIGKTDGSATYTPGTGATYTITVTNAGPSDATNVTLADTLPVGVTQSVNASCVAGPGANCGVITNLGTGFSVAGAYVPAAAGNLVYTVPVSFGAGMLAASITNSVTVTNLASSGAGSTATATDTDTLALVSDLAISKTDGQATYTPGNPISYTIVASNAGPSPVAGATVGDVVPASISGAAWTCVASAGSSCPASGSGNIAAAVNLLVGGTATFTLTGTVSASAVGNLVNTATVTAPGGVTDPNPGNNSATDTDTPNPIADLAVTKTDGVATVSAGGTTTYTITVTNNGPSAVTGATVTDPLPAGVASFAWTCAATAGSSCPASGAGAINTNAVNLLKSGVATFTVTATISGSATGTIVNTVTATVPAGTTDPTPGNNTATDTDTVSLVADLAVTKTDGSATYTPGNAITYTIVASNNGPSAVTGAPVADVVPASIAGVAWTCVASAGSVCGAASGVGNINTTVDLLSGGTATFTLSGTVSASTTGNLVNTATVTAPAGTTDPTPGNNSATDTDTPNPIADLAITKTDGSATYTAGNAITYTIVASNAGPSAVTGATVADTVPASIASPAWTCVASGEAAVPRSGSGNIRRLVNLLPSRHGDVHADRHRVGERRRQPGQHGDGGCACRHDGSDAGQQQRDRHRHAESDRRSRDHQDRRRGVSCTWHSDHLHHRRDEQRPERRHRRDSVRHGARGDRRSGLDLRGIRGKQLSRERQRQHQRVGQSAGRRNGDVHADGHRVGERDRAPFEHGHGGGAGRHDRSDTGQQHRNGRRQSHAAGFARGRRRPTAARATRPAVARPTRSPSPTAGRRQQAT